MTAPPGEQPTASMRPEDVPDELVDVFARAFWAARAVELVPGIQDKARETLAAVLPAHESTVRRELHFPTITPMVSGEWGVYCFACSEAAGDYVPRCLHDRDDWPPTLVLRDAPPSTLVDALADKRQAEHTRGDT